MQRAKLQKMMLLAMMIALDVVLSPLFRVEGMAPMSSVMNVLAGGLLGPVYGTAMALCCGVIRMVLLGMPPLALTGAVFGAFLAGLLYRMTGSIYGSMIGEIIGTGIIGSLLSYPMMVFLTGSQQGLYWIIYTPRFIGAALIGSFVALFVWKLICRVPVFIRCQQLFGGIKS
ncbi:energy coupling factor transporter S component ThiW [Enterococcus sp. 669A]|uniref:Energy coupling factor transporter S component ThiW n=1 Tax=Candidatus Enterococcus moelleringii TaxID=2815325 RepID=A0ABS3L4Z6_9ENTE|nr:energy coupling factor transporter S component ThiW [Enterococcus sp. 669A]MBO1304672.1 energy coupling factor transporter S component ThiW [Enterococcus sp. 669A]